MTSHSKGHYYIPGPSHWPITGSIAIFCLLLGAVNWIHANAIGPYLFLFGGLLLAYMLYGWFGAVIHENRAGLLTNPQMDRSYRISMLWFIFTEVMFFAAFFGALFYARIFSIPWIAGDAAHSVMTHKLLWPNFQAAWPLYNTPDPKLFPGPKAVLPTWGIPALNTLILLTSAATITVAHWALLKDKREVMLTFQVLTILLGLWFLGMQTYEYHLAYTVKGLKLTSGIYGTTFFMLTGFHGMHVTVGVIMLCVMLYRMYVRDFTKKEHFGFEATAWYWHFVDVVWLCLFVFVYWL